MSGELKTAAKSVHDCLPIGLTESVYHRSLEVELSDKGVKFTTEFTLPVKYKGVSVGRRRPDMFLPEQNTIVELKAGSTSGEEQLEQYLALAQRSDDYRRGISGVLIQFHDELQYTEYQP